MGAWKGLEGRLSKPGGGGVTPGFALGLSLSPNRASAEVGDGHGLAAEFGALVGGEDDFEGAQGFGEAGERHVFAFVQGVKEGLELGLVRVVADIAGVQHVHGEVAPALFVGLQDVGVQLVVQQAALAAHEVGVEVVGLQAVHHGGGFADGAVLELHQGDAGGVVFIRGEDFALGLGAETGDAFHLAGHDHEQGVEGVAAGGEQGAAAILFADVPAELAIPGADAVVVVHFAVVKVAQEALVDDGLGGLELAGEAALKADAAFDAVGLGGGDDFTHFFQGVGHGLFQDDVLPGLGGGHGLVAVLAGVAGDVHDMDVGIGQHGVDVLVGLDGAAVLGAQFRAVQRAGGVDGGDLCLLAGVDRVNVRGRCPAVTNDADVVFFHEGEKEEGALLQKCGAMSNQYPPFAACLSESEPQTCRNQVLL